MSSDSEDENTVRYGTPLQPYEEDEIPTKRKYQQPADQYAVDEHGRRRFHGAFTGGFSAGFGNTVGSQEGWTPSTFKSSRSEKAQLSNQKAEDFMDEEDRSEHGIAPRRMQTHSEFSGQKRSRPQGFHDGPIPGEPVLSQLLRPVHETAAVRILKSMGWKPGQGAGDRVTREQKKKAKEQQRVYGCYVPPELRQKTESNSDSSDSEVDYETLFAPDDYEPYILHRKSDRFGLGYSGLSRHSVLGNLVAEYGSEDRRSHLVMTDKGKKVSIRGQAFGVGAFEADDEDIYATEDMSHYDYTLGAPKEKEKPKLKKDALGHVLEGFTRSVGGLPPVPPHPPPALPRGYAPAAAGARRTRFEPTDARPRDQGLGRHELTANARGALLGETPPPNNKRQESIPSTSQHQSDLIAKITGRTIDFSSSSTSQNTTSPVPNVTSTMQNVTSTVQNVPLTVQNPTLTVQNPTSTLQNVPSTVHNPTSQLTIIDLTQPKQNADYISIKDSGKEIKNVFKPFASNPLKQKRYENFLENNALEQDGDMDRLSEWERERELTEFDQAAKLYKPLTGIMGDRFTHASQPDDATNPLLSVARSSINFGSATAEQIDAAAKGLYGVMTRSKVDWRPETLLCKRFNVPEPGVTRLEPKKDDKPKVSYSIFSYLESSVHDRESFTKEQTKFSGSKSLQRETTQNVQGDTKNSQNESNNPQNETKNLQKDTKSTQNKPKNIEFPRKLELTESNKRMTVAELFLKESEKQKEKGQEVTETINQFDKMDLYQSIFLTDSEEETDQIDPAETDYLDRPKNILRNNSPPRGIFADIDFDEINSWRRNTDTDNKKPEKDSDKKDSNKEPENVATEEKTNNPTNMDVDEAYGPKIPENIQKKIALNVNEIEIELPDSHKGKESIEINSSSSDSWVDASEVKNKKAKKKSKHKKHKSKHKKKSKSKKKDR